MLEEIVDETPLIWYAFFGIFGYTNDISVLVASLLSNNIADGVYLLAMNLVNGETKTVRYWLAD